MNEQIRDLLERAEASLLDYKSDIQFGSRDRDLLNDIRAALAAPAPVTQGEPVAWCELTPAGKIAYFDGRPMVMPGPVGNEYHTVPLYTAATAPPEPTSTGRSSTACDDQDAPEPQQ